MPTKLSVNGDNLRVSDDNADMPLLWFLREELELKGTKFGCGIGQCGACTVHQNGRAIRSCLVKLSDLNNADITTIEGLARKEEGLHPVQQAWVKQNVPQCGYCQPGQIMAAAAFLSSLNLSTKFSTTEQEVSDEAIDKNITNICRCGTYTRIRKAIKAAAEDMANQLK